MTDPATLLTAAKAAAHQGELGEAKRLFKKIRADHPDSDEAKEAAEGLRSAQLGISVGSGAPAPRRPANADDPAIQKVIVTDVDVSFGSMVVLLIKFSIALIPAAIILFVIGMVVAAVLGGLGGAFGPF